MLLMKPIRGRSKGTRKGGTSWLLCDRPLAGRATLVRGSSRRITTMTAGLRARSANISVINRRYSRFDRRRIGFIDINHNCQVTLAAKS